MKKKLLFGFIFFILIIGFIGGYIFANYNYQPVLSLPEKSENRIKLTDSLFIDPALSLDETERMIACINFDKVTDSITLKNLNVVITCIDNPEQYITLTYVLTYVDPLIPEHINYIKANTFAELPEHYKTVLVNREPWNTIMFYFKTTDIDKGKYYKYKITGSVIYKGQTINFEKEIIAIRKKQFVKIKMIT